MENFVILQTTVISMGIVPAPFWAGLYVSRHECGFMNELIKKDFGGTKKFYGIFRFIDHLCALKDGGECQNKFKKIYPKELKLKFWISHYFYVIKVTNFKCSHAKLS